MIWIGLAAMLFAALGAYAFSEAKTSSGWLLWRKGFGFMVMATAAFIVLRTFGYNVRTAEDIAVLTGAFILLSLGGGLYYPGRLR